MTVATRPISSAANPAADGLKVRQLGSQSLISVVIPCYNEQEVLPLLHDRFDAAARAWGIPYEVILVDDGSSDRTRELIAAIHAADPRWKMVGLTRNFGHQAALWTGLGYVSGDLVAVLDADLQDPPEVLPAFFRKWEEGFDIIYGVRKKRKENFFKRSAYFLFYRMLSLLSDVDIPADSGDFCVMDRRVVNVLVSLQEQRPFIRGLRAWTGYSQVEMTYERASRAAGEVKYTMRKLFGLAFDGILSSSIRPLRLATHMGLLVSLLSFVGIIFTFFQRIYAEQFIKWGFPVVPGFYTTIIVIFFLGGVQLLCVGIVGEYVGRIYENVKGRPISLIAQTIGFPEKDQVSRCPQPGTPPRL